MIDLSHPYAMIIIESPFCSLLSTDAFLYCGVARYDLRVHWVSSKREAALQMLHWADPELAAPLLFAASLQPSFTNDGLGYDFVVPHVGPGLRATLGLTSGGDGGPASKRMRSDTPGVSAGPQQQDECAFERQLAEGRIELFVEAKGSVRPWEEGFLLSQHEDQVARKMAADANAAAVAAASGTMGGGGGQPVALYRVAFISSLHKGLLGSCISFLRSVNAIGATAASGVGSVSAAEMQRVVQLSWVDLQHCTLDTASVTYRAVPTYRRQQSRP